LDLGAALAGFETIYAADSDPVAISTYRNNVSPHAECIDLSISKISSTAKGVDLLLGGPPCQGFSSAGPKKKEDPRNKLWNHYLEYVKSWKPKVFLMENVYGFLREFPAFSEKAHIVLEGKYKLFARRFVTQYYGVPQFRDRVIIQGVRMDVASGPLWPEPTSTEFYHYTRAFPTAISMASALEDLGPADDSGGMFPDHVSVPLGETDFAIARHIPNGGSLKDVPDKHLPKPYYGRMRTSKGWTWYYRKPRPEIPGRGVISSIRPNYATILAPDVLNHKTQSGWKWTPIKPSESTDKSGLYTSPVDPRRMTIRECARLQTFPDWFKFSGNLLDIHRQIGNAVPVEFSRRLTDSAASLIKFGENAIFQNIA
jgi:DNA (cytosine-5)-methyltransferase 1